MRPTLRSAIRLALVVATPIALYAGLRARMGGARAAVWAELPGTAPGEFRPRTLAFDAARRRVRLMAAQGGSAAAVLRLKAEKELRELSVTLGPPRGRRGPAADVRVRLFRPVGGVLVPATPLHLRAGAVAEWWLELDAGEAATPGRYVAPIEIASADGAVERLALHLHVWPFRLGSPAVAVLLRPAGDLPARVRERLLRSALTLASSAPPGVGHPLPPNAPRLAAWEAYRARAPWIDAGQAADWLDRAAGWAPTERLWALVCSVADLRMLALARSRGEPMVDALVARVLRERPASPDDWERVRRELAGLLNAPGLSR